MNFEVVEWIHVIQNRDLYSMLWWVFLNDLSWNKFLDKTQVHGEGLHLTDRAIRNVAWRSAAYRQCQQVSRLWVGSWNLTRTRACEYIRCKVYWCVNGLAAGNECKLQTALTSIITAVHLCGLSRAYSSRFIVHISTFPKIDFRWIIFAFLHCSTALLAVMILKKNMKAKFCMH